MPCVQPLKGWVGRTPGRSGRRPIVFTRSLGFVDRPRLVPCGRCAGCRVSRSSQWSVRARLEFLSGCPGSVHTFLTLTYSDDFVKPSLDFVHLRNFWKRLRKDLSPRLIRYIACGEYGEYSNRPHFHAIIFGWYPDDAVRYSSTMFTSEFVQSNWKYGRALFSEASTATAQYVAGYVVKKLALSSYPEGFVPPDIRASQHLGLEWVRANSADLMNDQVYLGEGRVAPVPKAILTLLDREAPGIADRIRTLRDQRGHLRGHDLDGPTPAMVEANILARLRPRELEVYHD